MVGSSRNRTLGWWSRAAIEFHFHPLAQGKFAHHDVQFVAHGQQFGQFVDGAVEGRGGDAVDFAVQFERFAGGKVPPELVFLPEQEGELPAIAVLPLPGNKAQHAGRAAGGIAGGRRAF